jgi:hypothetical protein
MEHMADGKKAQFSFKELDVSNVNSAPDIGLAEDWQRTGKTRGKKTYALTLKEEGLRDKVEQMENEESECSVQKKRASIYLFACCFYNCCFPCHGIERLLGPVCGTEFFFKRAVCLEIAMRRDRLLWFLNLLCFVVHTLFAGATFAVGAGNDMNVGIFRVKPSWENTGGRGYSYDVVEDFQVRFDAITGMFFALSAIFHGIWVLFGRCSCSDYFLWRNMNQCLCYLCV